MFGLTSSDFALQDEVLLDFVRTYVVGKELLALAVPNQRFLWRN
jgi:hypothetical protein